MDRKEKRRKSRLKAIYCLGGICFCCQEDVPEFLEIHHISNDGAFERKTLGLKEETIFRRIISGEHSGYRLFCSNCHKAITQHGKCPHEKWMGTPGELVLRQVPMDDEDWED